MKSRLHFYSLTLLFAAAAVWSAPLFVQAASPEEKTATPTPVPVEPDMHEFMEYVFQPTFKRLKPVMAAEPTDNQGWKAIKADSMILAEGGNLLLFRVPATDAADWIKHSVLVRDFGGKFYCAAQAKDFESARKHYELMVENCNACHKQFENGKHILTP